MGRKCHGSGREREGEAEGEIITKIVYVLFIITIIYTYILSFFVVYDMISAAGCFTIAAVAQEVRAVVWQQEGRSPGSS